GRHNQSVATEPRPEPVASCPELVEGMELLVLGLGPGPAEWLTPEPAAAPGRVDHVVGYAPYLERVPWRTGLQRHASGNTAELDRARFALELALRGELVALVSGVD